MENDKEVGNGNRPSSNNPLQNRNLNVQNDEAEDIPRIKNDGEIMCNDYGEENYNHEQHGGEAFGYRPMPQLIPAGSIAARRNEGCHDLGEGTSNNGEKLAYRPMPKLIPAGLVAPSNERPVAKKVVIANLHPDTEQCNVFKLLENLNITVLDIEMKHANQSPNPTMKYAVLHVNDDEEVKEVIKWLNGFMVKGLKLVVDSAEQFALEGKASLEKNEQENCV